MGKGKKKPLKGTPPVLSSLLFAASGGSSALSSDPERRNVNDVLGKDRLQKPVNARSDTGSPATKKRTESRTLTLEMNDAEGADDQDSLEDADRLDLDNSDFLEESMLAIVENRPDTEIPEDSAKPPAKPDKTPANSKKPPAKPDKTPADTTETEKGNPMPQSTEPAGKKVSPSPPPESTVAAPKHVSWAAIASGKEKPATTDKLPVKNLASVFTAAASKETQNSVFIKVMFPVDSNPKDPVKAARSQLIEYFKMVQSVDSSAALLKWGKDTGTASASCAKPKDLPTTLTGLQSFADQFRPKPEGGDTWCSLHIQVAIDIDEFCSELVEQARVRQWVAKRHALQTAYTETVGWILYSLPSMNVEFWTSYINTWIRVNFQKDPKHPPPVIGLEHRAIYDGLGKEAQKAMSKEERWAKRALHVICKRGEKMQTTGIIRAFLKSAAFTTMCKLPARLIPPLPYSPNFIFRQKYQEATMKHMKLTHFGTDTFTVFAFPSPDKKCGFLKDTPTIRSLLFSVKARDSPNGLFLSVEIAAKPMEQGGFVISYLKRHETEAVEKLSNLLAFFMHRFGENSLEHFTQEAVNQAEQTIWDKEHDRPITMEEQYLEEIADKDIEWVENLADIKFTMDLAMEVVLDWPKIANVPQLVLPENTDADTVKTFPQSGSSSTIG